MLKINPILMTLCLFLPFISSAQELANSDFSVQVKCVRPQISLTKEKLESARTLVDLDKNYKSSWIKSYASVEVWTIHNEQRTKSEGKNDLLTAEQKDKMNTADAGTPIEVKVYYLPDNNLVKNDIKEIRFTVWVDPDQEATFPGGVEALEAYLQSQGVNDIKPSSLGEFELATIKFTVDEEGRIINPFKFFPIENEEVDELLLDAVCNMPRWEPAAYANGVIVKQEFVLTVGNRKSCVVNLLDIREP